MSIFSRNPFDDSPDGLRRRLADLPPGVKWGALAAASVAVVFIGWLGLQGLAAKSNLEKARDSAEQAKDALLSGKSEDATRFAENAQFFAGQARAATHSVPWSIGAAVPFLGSPLKTTQQISDVVVGLADDVLLPAARVGGLVSPASLLENGRINLQLLRQEEPQLSQLAAAAAQLDTDAQAISKPAFLSVIGNARTQLQNQTAKLSQLLGNTALAARLAPSMLGADGPRYYMVVFQNNAEARGTGGLFGGYGILRFENGQLTVPGGLTPNYGLGGISASVDMGTEFNSTYGWTNPYTDFRNSNLSANFPYAAQIWKSMWDDNRVPEPSRGKFTLDGVIAIDPVALSYLLGAVGSVTMPDGEVITKDNIVELMQSTAYARFTDQNARKEYLKDVGDEVLKKVTTGVTASPRKLIDALGRAASERRIAMWSASPAEQQLLEETPLAHVIPDDPAPYAQVVVNNLAGNKMDYYLRREIEYAADGCDGDMRNSTIIVRLANTASDAPLPGYVGSAEGLADRVPLDVPNGSMVTSVRVIATKGSRLLGVTSNGERTSATQSLERGHPTFEVQVVIPPGEGGELTFRLSEPTSPGAPRVPIQPLIDNVTPKVSVPECSG
jgi:hypothetical protein